MQAVSDQLADVLKEAAELRVKLYLRDGNPKVWAQAAASLTPEFMGRVREVKPELTAYLDLSVQDRKAKLAERNVARIVPRFGPGTELKELLLSIGVKSLQKACICEEMMKDMNVYGIEGCREKFDELLAAFRENAKLFHWTTTIAKAATLAVLTGLAFKINWIDPYPDLINIAIDRAEAKAIKAT